MRMPRTGNLPRHFPYTADRNMPEVVAQHLRPQVVGFAYVVVTDGYDQPAHRDKLLDNGRLQDIFALFVPHGYFESVQVWHQWLQLFVTGCDDGDFARSSATVNERSHFAGNGIRLGDVTEELLARHNGLLG